jgi:hypothetical protein
VGFLAQMTVQDKILVTSGAIIDEAGGTGKVAQRFHCDPRVVSNWRRRGFPRGTYARWQKILDEIGVEAPSSLWGQHQ